MDETLPLPQPFSLTLDDIRRGPGVEDVVTELYIKLRPALVSYVYHLVGSTRDAEDVVQITFIQLFDQLNANVEIRNVRGWLYKVVHNLAIEDVRRSGRRETLFNQWLVNYEWTENADSIETAL